MIEIIKKLEANRFAWCIEIEHGTVLESCAIDALLEVYQKDHDMWSYYTYDKDSWVEFQYYKIARKKAINREVMDRYA